MGNGWYYGLEKVACWELVPHLAEVPGRVITILQIIAKVSPKALAAHGTLGCLSVVHLILHGHKHTWWVHPAPSQGAKYAYTKWYTDFHSCMLTTCIYHGFYCTCSLTDGMNYRASFRDESHRQTTLCLQHDQAPEFQSTQKEQYSLGSQILPLKISSPVEWLIVKPHLFIQL